MLLPHGRRFEIASNFVDYTSSGSIAFAANEKCLPGFYVYSQINTLSGVL